MRPMSPRLSHPIAAVSALALTAAGLLLQSSPPAAANGALPEAAWPACAAAEDEMCVESVSVEVDGEPVDYSAAGLTASVSTLAGEVSSFNWSVGGAWDRDDTRPGGFNTDLLDAEVTLVVRTGTWVPRMTTSLSRDLRISVAGDDSTGRTMTISGKPVHIDWDPALGTCYGVSNGAQGTECGDHTTRATAVGTGWRFMGNTQDMGTWSEEDRTQRGGMYVATDAQGGPHMSVLALMFYVYPERYWSLTLGNPHLDVDGHPVTGSLTAWLPESYFTAAGSTVEEALAAGFSVRSIVDEVETVVSPEVSELNGGILISLNSIGYSVRTLEVHNEPAPAVAKPGAPTSVAATGGAGRATVTWSAPVSGGAAASYTASAYSKVSGGTLLGSCGAEAPTTGCPITGLAANTRVFVSVTATNGTGSSDPSTPRVAALTLPSKPTLTGSARTTSSVAWTFARQTGVTYTATATRGATAIAASRIAISGSGQNGTVTVSGQDPGTEVTVTLRATNDSGSVTSQPATRSTVADNPGRVTGLAIGALSGGKVTLSWSPSAANAASVTYRYRWSRVGAAWSEWKESSRTTATLTGLVKGRTYRVALVARNSADLLSTVTERTFTA